MISAWSAFCIDPLRVLFEKLKTPLKFMRALLYTILLISFFLVSARLKNEPADPLDKPTVWQKLTVAPSDSSLWALYIGKPWVCMTYSEKERVSGWIEQLRKEVASHQKDASVKPENADDFWGTNSEANQQVAQAAAAREKKEVMDYLFQLEQVMVEEPSFLTELKTNIGQNFVIIEDTYREEFMALGLNYKDYQSTHKDGKYSKEKWVAERSRELQELKRKEFEKIKSQMLASE